MLVSSIMIAVFFCGIKTINAQNTDYLVDENTYVKVCFWAEHTYVSDIGFYLKAPGHELSEPGDIGVVQLCPAASDWGPDATHGSWTGIPWSVLGCVPSDENTVCNAGNNIGNETTGFCFSTHITPGGIEMASGTPALTPCVCDLPTPLVGTFASVGTWETIYGFDITQEGWTVQIYDCESADIGTLKRATIQFVKHSECDSIDILWDSGETMFAINDNHCSAWAASQYLPPLNYFDFQYFEEENPIICGVSVDENNNSEIFWNNFSSEIVDSVILFKTDNQNSEMYFIGAVKFSEAGNFIDTLSLSEETEEEYIIGFKNICGYINLYSLAQKSIFLTTTHTNNSVTLDWNENENLLVDSISIYRGISPNDLEIIETVPYTDLSYIDVIDNYNFTLFYKISYETQLCDPGKDIRTISSNISEIYIDDFVGLSNIKNNEKITIVPNPANDIICVNTKNLISEFKIFDINGETLLIKENFRGGNIFIGNLSSGIYFVQISTEEGKTSQKLIIE